MDWKILYENESYHPGYGAGDGTTELYEYECPCGNGKIIEEHDNIPGFRDHDVYICCKKCSELFDLNTVHGIRGWKLDGFFVKGLTNSKLRLDNSLKNFNLKQALIDLFEFLSWVFALREKCKLKREIDNKIFSLKEVLNLFKHDYDLIKLNFLVEKKESFEENLNSNEITSIVFGKIDDLKNINKDRLNRYKQNLENCNVIEITNFVFNDTLKLYNK